jgi:predicted ABC-type ATPase
VNADLIAAGLSPLRPALAARAAGRLVLAQLDRLATARQDFAFESTLSGKGYVERLQRWKRWGYHDSWELYDNSGPVPVLLEKVP